MSDLRDFFGAWTRCGNTAFWKRTYPEHTFGGGDLYVDPVDGIYVAWQGDLVSRGRAVEVIRRRIPDDVPSEAFNAAVEGLPQHMRFLYRDFVHYLTVLTVLDAGKTKMLRFFLEAYKEQPPEYQGYWKDFAEPARDEILMATFKVLGTLWEAAVIERKTVLREDLEEVLGELGILEC